MRPEKNRENFDILSSHNMLSARCLQKKAETSIYKNAEIGKVELSVKNLIPDGTPCPATGWRRQKPPRAPKPLRRKWMRRRRICWWTERAGPSKDKVARAGRLRQEMTMSLWIPVFNI